MRSAARARERCQGDGIGEESCEGEGAERGKREGRDKE